MLKVKTSSDSYFKYRKGLWHTDNMYQITLPPLLECFTTIKKLFQQCEIDSRDALEWDLINRLYFLHPTGQGTSNQVSDIKEGKDTLENPHYYKRTCVTEVKEFFCPSQIR